MTIRKFFTILLILSVSIASYGAWKMNPHTGKLDYYESPATTVTISDDESTDDAHEIVFTTDNSNLESDGDLTYNPNSGTLTVGTADINTAKPTTIELGHDTDTTLARDSAGVVSVEGVTLETDTHASEHAISGADPLDSISEGNSNAEIIDSGTGEFNIDIDGEQQVDVTDGVVGLINSLMVRPMTTTEGHKFCLGAYDVDGTTWTNILCFENANTPKMELQSGTEFSGLGAASMPVVIGGTDADGRTLTAAEMNQMWLSSGAGDWDIPDQCDSATGYWVTIKATAAHIVSLDLVDTSDQFVLSDGTEVAAANELDTAGASGNMVTVVCMATNKWYVTGEIGTCVDGGASD